MLRTRFTVAVAAAVAAVTLVITAVAFLVVRSDLQNQVSQELRDRSVSASRDRARIAFFLLCGFSPPAGSELGTT